MSYVKEKNILAELNTLDIDRIEINEGDSSIGFLKEEGKWRIDGTRGFIVRENIMLPLQHSDVPSAEREEFVDRVLQEFGIEELGDYKGYMLSGGERRRASTQITAASLDNKKSAWCGLFAFFNRKNLLSGG